MHNLLPNSRCMKSSPHELLFGQPPSTNMLYPFGADAIVHIPVVQQPHKLAPRGIACQLLKPLITTLGNVPTKRYFDNKNAAIDALPLTKDVTIPEHLGQALSGKFQDQWRATCKRELDQMLTQDVWEEVIKTDRMKTIGHCWVFNIKQQTNGDIEKFKAQLVVRDDQQRPGIDCTKTYAPNASLMSLRLVLAHAVCHRWTMASFDISGAYLHSPVKETVFVEPPTSFGRNSKEGSATQEGLVQHEAGRPVLVDLPIQYPDLDGFHRDGVAILDFKKQLCAEVEIKWHDIFTQIVGLECTVDEVLPTNTSSPDEAILDATPFRLVVGSLAYLVSGSRPDLAFAVNYLARHSMSPMVQHWGILDHVMGYLLKMQSHQLMLRPGNISLNQWSDAGWGGNLEHSQMGFMLKLGDAPILWASKWQGVVALSTCAAEYVALSDSTQHFVQAINQLTQLAESFNKEIFCDNQASVQVSIDNQLRKWMRYLHRALFFVNNTIRKYNIKVTWVPTGKMQADALTKLLSRPALQQALAFLCVDG
ncbi:hypothetical protein O181_066025 [Austropuccinia psidii MF-1]|uniref:Reverse transcriptase Ty1/copia-type domain-containing protein n=1 Tax=Austropuccinia psidii MF-1 TaxID=1389203 RepID=A0A9Q3EW98_9BASI|nr:hypothetical protein [Austropuccinia psidii MF-1]